MCSPLSRALLMLLAFSAVTSCSCNKAKSQSEKVSASCIEQQHLSANELGEIRKEIHADDKSLRLDEIFHRKYEVQGFNGNVLIAQKGVVLYEGAFGKAVIGGAVEDSLRLNSKFQLSSTSKTFTGAAVMKLHEQGRLSLQDSVQKFYPDFPYRGVTVEMLLTHRSGLPDYMKVFDGKVKKANPLPPDNQTLMKWFAKYRPQRAGLPDRGFVYNNSNYAVLAAIVEHVSGMPFDAYLKKTIFDPLGMKNTRVRTSSDDEMFNHLTYGYEGSRRIPVDYFDEVTGDKGVYSTVGDLWIWYKALRSNCFLHAETMDEAWTPHSFERPGYRNYGYGFRMVLENTEDIKPKYVFHNGWWKGYSSTFWFNPENDYVVIVLGNRVSKSVYQVGDVLEVLEGKMNNNEMDHVMTE